MDNKNMLEKVGERGVAAPISVGRGFEEPTDKDQLIIPRAKLLQALSPEVQDDKMSQGLIINSLTKEVLPEVFIPIFKFTTYIRFNPRDKKSPAFDPAFDPGAVLWRSNDPSDPKVRRETQFGPNGEKPLATTFLNFFSYFPGVPMPVVVSFFSSSYKEGKRLYSLARFGSNQQYPDMFCKKYKLTSVQKENDLGKFYVLQVTPTGIVEDKNDLQLCEIWYDSFSSKPVVMHEEGLNDEPAAGEERVPGQEG